LLESRAMPIRKPRIVAAMIPSAETSSVLSTPTSSSRA
jgi:hypothetical protein